MNKARMTFISIRRLMAGACLALAGVAQAADDAALKKAAQQLERHYYESVAATLRAGGAEPDATSALILARAYAGNARLQRALQRSSLEIGRQYLRKLAAQGGRERSQYAALYYGEYLIEAGKAGEGMAQLRRFLEQKNLRAPYRELALARLAGLQKGQGDTRITDALARIELAAAASQQSGRQADAVKQLEPALSELGRGGAVLPMRAVTKALTIYTRAGQHDKALALLAGNDISRPSLEEAISATKVLRFYDPALMGSLADLYQARAEQLLQRARGEARYKAVAGYFLADLYLDSAQYAKAGEQLAGLGAGNELPAAYRERVLIMRAAVEAWLDQATHGKATFADLAGKHAQDPVLLGETLRICLRVKASCAAVVNAARALAQTNQGERFRGLHQAVGEQYASEGQPERALQALETARDKSNKNRVDTNDPLLLARLADLYFSGKSFSESLEIYFELGKEFPAVRQLQETAQGVYSTEYRSAGDVKIF